MRHDTPLPELTEPDDAESSWVFIGLDGEMSSADITTGGALIQAGAAAWTTNGLGERRLEVFTSLIRPSVRYEWSKRAAQVHGIPQTAIDAAPPAAHVDDQLHDWLLEHGGEPHRRTLVPIGLNVASFDIPFFKAALPKSTSLLARRSVDLNAVLFTLESWDPNPKTAARDFAGWKRSMKSHANAELAKLGLATREHDAGFDAAQALIGWEWLRAQIHAPVLRVRELDTELNRALPLRSELGEGLLRRLEHVDQHVLERIVAGLDPHVNARRWFGTKHPSLSCTPLEALTAGRSAEVLSLFAE